MDGATPFCREPNTSRRSEEWQDTNLAPHVALGAGRPGWSSPSLERVDRRCCCVHAFNCFACAVPEMSEPDRLRPCAASMLRERIGRNGDCEIKEATMLPCTPGSVPAPPETNCKASERASPEDQLCR
jgi:hypothetical protein